MKSCSSPMSNGLASLFVLATFWLSVVSSVPILGLSYGVTNMKRVVHEL